MAMRAWIAPLALAGAVAIAYFNSFRGVFQFDDYNVIVCNPVVHSWQAWLSDLHNGIRPFLKFTYMLNWTSGLGAFGFHIVNTLTHAVNAVLVYFLALKFIDCLKGAKTGFLIALIFALHPVQTEAVTYISGRSTSLMAMFYLLSILAYIRGTDENKNGWRCIISPALFIMAVLTKETAATLPLALFIVEKVRRPEKKFTEILKKQAAHWALFVFMAAFFLIHGGYSFLIISSLETRDIKSNILSQINGISYLISRLFLPGSLNIDPDLPVIEHWTPLLVIQAIFLASLFLTGVVFLRRNHVLGFGLIWFFLHLLPTNSILPRIDVANERHLYLPSWGFFLALGIMTEKIYSRLRHVRKLFAAGGIILFAALGYFTASRNIDYRSEIALWENTAGKSPNKARVHNNLGYAYALEDRYEDAKKAYLTALRLMPDYNLARNNLQEIEKMQNIKR